MCVSFPTLRYGLHVILARALPARAHAGSWRTLTLDGGKVVVDAVGTYGYEVVDEVKASLADAGVAVLGVEPEHEVDDVHGLRGGRGGDVGDGGAVQVNEA